MQMYIIRRLRNKIKYKNTHIAHSLHTTLKYDSNDLDDNKLIRICNDYSIIETTYLMEKKKHTRGHFANCNKTHVTWTSKQPAQNFTPQSKYSWGNEIKTNWKWTTTYVHNIFKVRRKRKIQYNVLSSILRMKKKNKKKKKEKVRDLYNNMLHITHINRVHRDGTCIPRTFFFHHVRNLCKIQHTFIIIINNSKSNINITTSYNHTFVITHLNIYNIHLNGIFFSKRFHKYIQHIHTFKQTYVTITPYNTYVFFFYSKKKVQH